MTMTSLALTSTIPCDASIDRVWEVFTRAERWPEWSEVVEEVLAVPQRWEAGERLAFRLRMGPGVVGFDVRLDEVVPRERVVWSSVRWSVTGTRTHRFLPVEGGTRIEDHKHFAHAFMPLAWIYPRAVIERMSRTWLRDLAREAEAA